MYKKVRLYINLTAGLAYYEYYKLENNNVVFCHLQSSHLESKSYNRFFYSLPDDLLLHLALGYNCIIIDCSSNNRGKSKIIRIGIPLIRFVLRKRWFNNLVYENGLDKKWLHKVLNNLERHTKRKLDYYRNFIITKDIKLKGIYKFIEKEDRDLIIKNFLKEKI